jgi:hypothetical protein
LEGVSGDVVATATRIVTGARLARMLAACGARQALLPRRAVVRVAATGESVTLLVASGRALLACDGASRGGSRARWCGRAFGRLQRGRLPDPRLDLTCTTGSGKPIAFAWIEPARRARYVVVGQHGYAEAYEVVAGAPVRVVTTEVDLARSSATFDLSEHDAHGRRLRGYRLETTVAG